MDNPRLVDLMDTGAKVLDQLPGTRHMVANFYLGSRNSVHFTVEDGDRMPNPGSGPMVDLAELTGSLVEVCDVEGANAYVYRVSTTIGGVRVTGAQIMSPKSMPNRNSSLSTGPELAERIRDLMPWANRPWSDRLCDSIRVLDNFGSPRVHLVLRSKDPDAAVDELLTYTDGVSFLYDRKYSGVDHGSMLLDDGTAMTFAVLNR